MSRKPVPRVEPADLPPWQCNDCWFYSPIEIDHGACYAYPPAAIIDSEDNINFPRLIVLPEDKGCIHWKARHKA